MCLNETYCRVQAGKCLSDMVPIKNGLKQGDAFIATDFLLCFSRCHQDHSDKPGGLEIRWFTSAYSLCKLMDWVEVYIL